MPRKSKNNDRTGVPYSGEIKARMDNAAANRAETDVEGQRRFYALRNFWGRLLAVALIASIAFQFLLAWAVGSGALQFRDYQTFLNIIAGENFVQVVGLCAIVVKFLFPKDGPPQ